MAQNNLGNALLEIGKREAGTARLEEALAAIRSALEESALERAPLDWAAVQSSLGSVLLALGRREVGVSRLKEALKAFDEYLEVASSTWPEGWTQEVRSGRDDTLAEIARR
jgi:tetratricopeptide (TPR) repeat protein